ncbi:hypothetical protein SAMN06297144_1501 [Sphingomonas guangdongensis]|uniref:Uncharacterized protein n=1 Tax=Sphingomonas guangdongensis TaxID=1141890 RepID=A0A285QX43_9SPHN|nr:hypothetical protein [Sphingomonas guangdongensis]SOB86396.1 hypothetical protein SAMN06297144_1501 [Sphingomonas guangdongensis]
MSTDPTRSLADLAVQHWKLCAALERETAFMSVERSVAAQAQLRFARRRLDAILAGENMALACYDGARWTADVPASPVNADDVAGTDPLIEATIEPTILADGRVLHPGKILLKQG